jgi:CHRD domain
VQRKFTAAIVLVVVAALGVAALALGAARDSYKVSAALKPKGEVPAPKAPPGAKGTFTGKYVENSKGALLTWKLVFSGLSGKATAAHIHKGRAGKAGPVLVPLCGPCKSPVVKTVTVTSDQRDAIERGATYVNVHTKKNAGGEIRGQIKATE